MSNEKKLKQHAILCGADIAGIASVERLRELPPSMNPLSIFPEAKSVIVLGYRIFRGCYRGIEEGTWWASYNLMGYNGIKWVFQPVTMWNFAKVIEDAGYEAVPVVDNFPWTNIDKLDNGLIGQDFINVNRTAFGSPEKYSGKWSHPVDASRPAPDVFIPFKLLAYAAGLGNIGHSGMFLTPEFGPRQKFSCIITDMPLAEDPIYDDNICDNCMECVKNCPAGAISEKDKSRISIAGRNLEWGRLDFDKCSVSFHGGAEEYNPFITKDSDRNGFKRQPYTESMKYKLDPINFDGRGVEGMRGCQMACFMHLEKTDRLTNKFVNSFRRKKEWKLNPDRKLMSEKEENKTSQSNRIKIDE